MTTLRFLDNDGLDGILPSETASTPYKYLIWVGIVFTILAITLLAFLYSSRETIVDSSLSSSALKETKLAEPQFDELSSVLSQDKTKNKNPSAEFENTVLKSKNVSPPVNLSDKQTSLDKNTTIVNDHSADIQPNVLDLKLTQVKETTNNISYDNQLNGSENNPLKYLKNNALSINNTDSSDKQEGLEKNNNVINNEKGIAIKLSQTYVFELSAKKIESIVADDVSSLTNFIHQCNNEIKIVGHTCNLGPATFNYQLGLARAKSMQQYLINQGANPNNLTISSKGMDQPIASNATKSGRKLNRRVELLCIKD